MEKLEKHIKENLEKREIKPSADSWEKVAAQLNVKDNNPRKNRYLYAVAAVFVGVVLVSALFFKEDNPTEETIEVVKTEEQLEQTDTLKKEIKNAEIKLSEKNAVAQSKEESDKKIIEDVGLDDSFEDVQVVQVETDQDHNELLLEESDDLIAQKVQEVVAQVQLLESINPEVSDAEVDSLLRAAEQQILSERVFVQSGSVDAMALLTEVEDELDGSFRNQIFDALKEGYFKLRTAVADRNN
ncbi:MULTISPECIES: hypothetical protein [Flavobacteriaceae]|uniref:hypothetical protein n=1 Tax=Flavobacteriaceae TaxID=49546 RepID=UPI00149208AC|nr:MULTISPECIES: hypothetical protein [Allomuricauda]MDC6365832.1 hypothetical protein [Muricauda sp. AC10]